MELTDVDRRLLRVIQSDAGLTVKEVAERAAVSPSTAWRRLQDLESAGVIIGRVTVLDPQALGLTVTMMVHVNLTEQTADARAAFQRFIMARPEIQQCFAVTGAHDYTLVSRARSVEEVERFLMHELLALPVVASAHSHLVLRALKNATELPV